MNPHPGRTIGALVVSLAASIARGEFAFHDGDTVAFLGDSITAARGYTKIVGHYMLMRFPERKVRFVNAGQGGDTAAGCLSRLDRDVFSHGANIVTVAFGINDIGWGMKANDSRRDATSGVAGLQSRGRAGRAARARIGRELEVDSGRAALPTASAVGTGDE